MFGNADDRLARGFLETHRLALVGPRGRIEGLRMRGRRHMTHRFCRMDGFPVVRDSHPLSRHYGLKGALYSLDADL